jgi:hypothetical protein
MTKRKTCASCGKRRVMVGDRSEDAVPSDHIMDYGRWHSFNGKLCLLIARYDCIGGSDICLDCFIVLIREYQDAQSTQIRKESA